MNNSVFSSIAAEFTALRSYSRWNDKLGRRETWDEVVDRYYDFLLEPLSNSQYCGVTLKSIKEKIKNLEVFPSMRLLWSSGKAAQATNVAAYNCAFRAVDELKAFSEALYCLACGAGVGYSVERKYIRKLPKVKPYEGTVNCKKIADSKEGWADSVLFLLNSLTDGKRVMFDYSDIRPKGARLKTFGGKASGPEPLKELHVFICDIYEKRRGSKITSSDANEIMCMIAQAIVVGGVRRSALISLCDLDDQEMALCKSGHFWETKPYLANANISAVYDNIFSPTENADLFWHEWNILQNSGTGERGIFNLRGLIKNLTNERIKVAEKYNYEFGTNPCGEINLLSSEFCNLSTVVVRPKDTFKTMAEKIKMASILGTIQSTLTNFPYLSPRWKEICEAERLLGVSITGQHDNLALLSDKNLVQFREIAQQTNIKVAKILGINPSLAVTTVKPEGTTSCIASCASGMHPWWSEYFIRRIRVDSKNAIFKACEKMGVPWKPEVGQSFDNFNTAVLEFPIAIPEGSTTRKNLTAMEQLQRWLKVKKLYTDHNPSITIYVDKDEWKETGQWVLENFNNVGGLSFLPKNDAIYPLAPFTEISKDEYDRMMQTFPKKFAYDVLFAEETEDTGSLTKELSCSSGSCEII